MRSGASLKYKLNKTFNGASLNENAKNHAAYRKRRSDQCKLRIFRKQLVFSDDVSSDVNKGRPSAKYS